MSQFVYELSRLTNSLAISIDVLFLYFVECLGSSFRKIVTDCEKNLKLIFYMFLQEMNRTSIYKNTLLKVILRPT